MLMDAYVREGGVSEMLTLESGIVVLVGINVLVGKLVRNNKRTGWNKYRVLDIFSSPLKLICALTGQSYSHFQTLSQFSCFRALKRGI